MTAIIKYDIDMGIFLDYRIEYFLVILTSNKDLDVDIFVSLAIRVDVRVL